MVLGRARAVGVWFVVKQCPVALTSVETRRCQLAPRVGRLNADSLHGPHEGLVSVSPVVFGVAELEHLILELLAQVDFRDQVPQCWLRHALGARNRVQLRE